MLFKKEDLQIKVFDYMIRKNLRLFDGNLYLVLDDFIIFIIFVLMEVFV